MYKSFDKAEEGQRPSASEHNKITKWIAGLARSMHIQGYVDSTGLHTRRTPTPFIAHKLFKVHSEATGDGVYNCYEQTLDATEWVDTSGTSKVDNKNTDEIEVLNLAEFDPEATYVAHLKADDLIAAWQIVDDEHAPRWIGLPLRQANADRPRRAYCKTDAGAGTTIVCYLDTDATGTEITVHCSIHNGANLNAALPRLEDGKWIMVTKIGTTWYCESPFAGSEDCACSEA